MEDLFTSTSRAALQASHILPLRAPAVEGASQALSPKILSLDVSGATLEASESEPGDRSGPSAVAGSGLMAFGGAFPGLTRLARTRAESFSAQSTSLSTEALRVSQSPPSRQTTHAFWEDDSEAIELKDQGQLLLSPSLCCHLG